MRNKTLNQIIVFSKKIQTVIHPNEQKNRYKDTHKYNNFVKRRFVHQTLGNFFRLNSCYVENNKKKKAHQFCEDDLVKYHFKNLIKKN